MKPESMLDAVVVIRWIHDGNKVSRGMWVCIGRDYILTSAHVVRDDSMRYEVWGMRYEVSERDFDTDIAYIKIVDTEPWAIKNICHHHRQYIWKHPEVFIWQSITISVMREGILTSLTGTVTSLTGTILAYDTLGRTQPLSDIIMTDISLLPWDSGAPILDMQGRVLDVVHVE